MKRTAVSEKFIIVILLCLTSNVIALVPAFPGAEGSGCWATGGRGGDVYEVNNITNAGPGSIVDALSEGNRTIVFRVSGTIELNDVMLEPKSNTTIAGQTAPGDGICIKGRIHIVGGVHDIIIRYIRIRVDEGAANSSGDAIDIDDGSNIIIDHVSASYARDETISCQEDTDFVTVQWCIMSEALTFEGHSYGSLIRGAFGQQKTYHHNLYAHNNNRNPRPGNYTATSSDPEGLHFDFRNNVVYNWAGGHPGYNADTSSTSRYNFVGNVFIRGAESSGSMAFREDSKSSYAYWSGNAYGSSYRTIFVLPDQWFLVTFNGFSTAEIDAYKARSYEIPMEAVTTTSASWALTDVLTSAGASSPSRDSVDTRIVNDVIKGTGGSIANTSSSSWPVLNSLPAPVDTDHDGMPDTWEITHGLNPDDAADRNNYDLNANYTNLEVYLYRLVTALTIRKCTVTAGKTQASDANLLQDAADINNIKDYFTASGTASLPTNREDINHIDISIVSGDGNVVYSETIDFNDQNDVVLKHGKYKYSHRITKAEPIGAITSLKIDFSRNPQTFALTAKNINLTGLACPVELDFVMDSNLFWGNANETVANGKTKLIPIRLMRTYQDTLRIKSAKAKASTSPAADSFTVKGELAVETVDDVNLAEEDVTLTWGDQTFVIPAGSMIPTSNVRKAYKCSNITLDEGGIAAGKFDLDKCTFNITVKNADLDVTSGAVDFGLSFAAFDEEKSVNLP